MYDLRPIRDPLLKKIASELPGRPIRKVTVQLSNFDPLATPLAEAGAELELEDGAASEDEEAAAADCAEPEADSIEAVSRGVPKALRIRKSDS